MNAFEIAEAVSKLAGEAFDPANFPFAFLEAFGNKEATIARLRSGSSNGSDVPGAVLQRNNIHLAVCAGGETAKTLASLRDSAATKKQKAKFILATDGEFLEAEDLTSGEAIAFEYRKLDSHFGFFLPLAGITTVKQIHNNPVDIQATGRLNRLYVELLRENPDWGTEARRHELNQFMARLIFCFFAEDTDIFHGDQLFTKTVEQMSDSRSGNTHEVIAEIFRAMDIPLKDRTGDEVKPWANVFPYVNGGLFTNTKDVPHFSRIARSYFLHAGRLDWRQINPDIFGSMIQAVADDEERGELGMHYTSVPNILKVLNPLFLDDLREQLEAASDNPRSLLNLRKRMARIRVFDPACGSGNFLVIAYKEMRRIEAEINQRRGESSRRSDIPLTNFRGIELRDFAAEIARLALIIAEYQCDVLYRGQKDALLEFLPLDAMNWITCGNALHLDWSSLMDTSGSGVKLHADDLFHTPLEQAQIDFDHSDGEIFVCGNPPYVGATVKAPKGASKETKERLKREAEKRKADLKAIFEGRAENWKLLDYVAGWLMKAADFGKETSSATAFVTTNSVCQGQQVPVLWPLMFKTGQKIAFAHTSFKWTNLAANNAGVTVVIVGLSQNPTGKKKLFSVSDGDTSIVKEVDRINAYLVPAQDVIVEKRSLPIAGLHLMDFGNKPADGGNLLLNRDEVSALGLNDDVRSRVVRRFLGSEDSINGKERYCLWLDQEDLEAVSESLPISQRLSMVAKMRTESEKPQTVELAEFPYRFGEIRQTGRELPIVIPRHSSEDRKYLPFVMGNRGDIVADSAAALYDAPLWNVAVYTSRLHLVWIATVCGKIKTDYRYSNTLGWNTFPVPQLIEKNKADLTRCAEGILLARETHWPATIAELYDPEGMPEELRQAHERNDEVLERIYIGRRFKNDTERLEKLFELYTKMTADKPVSGKAARKQRA